MNSHLLSCEKLDIPDALALDHEQLRTELVKAASRPGRIGLAARKVAHLYLPHFAKEEQMISSAFGLLKDLAARRLLPDALQIEPMIGLFSARHHAALNDHKAINAAVEQLLLEASQEQDADIVDLVCKLSDHERIEDQVMYPTALFFARSVRDALAVH